MAYLYDIVNSNIVVKPDSTQSHLWRCDMNPSKLPRKSSKYTDMRPVPKPTQVVEESILRCSSDSRLRN